jgi:hypothetical protein
MYSLISECASSLVFTSRVRVHWQCHKKSLTLDAYPLWMIDGRVLERQKCDVRLIVSIVECCSMQHRNPACWIPT